MHEVTMRLLPLRAAAAAIAEAQDAAVKAQAVFPGRGCDQLLGQDLRPVARIFGVAALSGDGLLTEPIAVVGRGHRTGIRAPSTFVVLDGFGKSPQLQRCGMAAVGSPRNEHLSHPVVRPGHERREAPQTLRGRRGPCRIRWRRRRSFCSDVPRQAERGHRPHRRNE